MGLFLCIYPFGKGVIQIVPPTLLSYLAIRLFPRHCFELTWIATFPYLVWLQVINASGLNVTRGGMDFVGAIMVLTLKLISLAGSRQDSFIQSKGRPLSPYRASHVLDRPPSVLEYLSFVFGIGNLLAGPYVEFTEHVDFMELKGDWGLPGGMPLGLGLGQGFFLLLQGVSFMGSHILVISIYGWGIMGDDAWIFSDAQKARPLAVKLAYQVFCGFAHQIKYYLLWKFSESAAVFSGFDFLGYEDSALSPNEDLKGKKKKAKWGRVTNVRLLGMWGSDSARIVPQHWNIRTGVFLKNYVYERIPGKPGFFHVLLTQLFTALWHGLYPGYIIFFVGTVFYLQAATVIHRAEGTVLPLWLVKSSLWWLVKVAWTDIAVCYMSMAFVLLEWHKSIAAHADVYFLPHMIMLALCVTGFFLPKIKRDKQLKDE